MNSVANPLTDFITSSFGSVINSISDVIGHFVADPNEKLRAQLELSKIATDFQIQVLQTDRDIAVQQATVITAEAKSESWIARNWRPLIMLQFGFIIGYNFILAPIFSVQSIPIPDDMWQLLKLGLGGYIIGRSVEKIVPEVTKTIIAGKQ